MEAGGSSSSSSSTAATNSGGGVGGGASTASAKVNKVTAADAKTGESFEFSYIERSKAGSGSFGVVTEATMLPSNRRVAIKKVLQDRRYKNRELQIMRMLDHCNVVSLKCYYYSHSHNADEVYLNLVLEFVPDTIQRLIRYYNKHSQFAPVPLVKMYAYQIFRSLAYIHSLGIAHRDIKPQNLLIDTSSCHVKLCDFGSAKVLVPSESNVAYICSRYYRAPELIFGATSYTTKIDVWSAACVLGEMITGTPMFPGDSGVDQLVEIIKVMGTPKNADIKAMNPSCTDSKFPQVVARSWNSFFGTRATPDLVSFVQVLLRYDPESRLTAWEAMADPYFDDLRARPFYLPNGRKPPTLFDFTPEELAIQPSINSKLQPLYSLTKTQKTAASSSAAAAAAGTASKQSEVSSAPPAAPSSSSSSSSSAAVSLSAATANSINSASASILVPSNSAASTSLLQNQRLNDVTSVSSSAVHNSSGAKADSASAKDVASTLSGVPIVYKSGGDTLAPGSTSLLSNSKTSNALHASTSAIGVPPAPAGSFLAVTGSNAALSVKSTSSNAVDSSATSASKLNTSKGHSHGGTHLTTGSVSGNAGSRSKLNVAGASSISGSNNNFSGSASAIGGAVAGNKGGATIGNSGQGPAISSDAKKNSPGAGNVISPKNRSVVAADASPSSATKTSSEGK